MYLMRRELAGPRAAVSRCRERRSCVEPNPGFVAALRRLAGELGIEDDTPSAAADATGRRRDADAGGGGGGDDGGGGDGAGGWGAQLRLTRGEDESAAASAAAAAAAVAARATAMAAAIAAKAAKKTNDDEEAPLKAESLLGGYMNAAAADADDDDDKNDAKHGERAAPRIDVYKGSDLVETIPLTKKGSLSFGRDRDCDVPLAWPSMPRGDVFARRKALNLVNTCLLNWC